jgi:hypothetical protein
LITQQFKPISKMNIIKTLLSLLVLAFLAISFMTFDLASLNLDMPAGRMIRDNPILVGSIAGFLLIALLADRIVGPKHYSLFLIRNTAYFD